MTPADISPKWLEVKETLWQTYGGEPWFTGVGIGADSVVVMVLAAGDGAAIPTVLEGVPISIRVTGRIVPLSAAEVRLTER